MAKSFGALLNPKILGLLAAFAIFELAPLIYAAVSYPNGHGLITEAHVVSANRAAGVVYR